MEGFCLMEDFCLMEGLFASRSEGFRVGIWGDGRTPRRPDTWIARFGRLMRCRRF